MRKIFSLSVLIIGLLVGLQSCERFGINDKEPALYSSVKYVGFNYVIVDVELEDFGELYEDGEFNISSTSKITQNNSLDWPVTDNHFYPVIYRLAPNTDYIGEAELQGVLGPIIKFKVEGAVKDCLPALGISGDFSGVSSPLKQEQYTISGSLVGELSKIKFVSSDGFGYPLYTTYNDNGKAPHSKVRANITVEVTLANGTTYDAKFGYPIFYEFNVTNDRSFSFCNVVFVNSTGNEIVLSGKLEIQ